MSMHKITYIERVLIALHPDGSFKGAHQESLSIIGDGDTVLASVQEPPTALTAAALALALPAQGALLAQLAAVMAERDKLLAQLAAVMAERDKLLAAALTSPVASPAHAEAPVAPPVVEEPVVAVVVEEPAVAPLEADPAAGSI